MKGYGKIFTTCWSGSMAGAGPIVFSVWAYAIAHSLPPDGTVELNPLLVAAGIGGITPDQVEEAVTFLCGPDEKTNTEGFNGARMIKEGPFRYRLVNWIKYRNANSTEEQRAKNAEAQRRSRERKVREEAEQKRSLLAHPPIVKEVGATLDDPYPWSVPEVPELALDPSQPIDGAAGTGGAKVQKSSKPRKSDKGYTAEFEAFWIRYPRKDAKEDGFKAWSKQTEETKLLISTDVPLRAAKVWRGMETKHIPQLATYLNGKRWQDPLMDSFKPAAKQQTMY